MSWHSSVVKNTHPIAVTIVEPAGKASFVYNAVRVRLGQCNGK